MPLLYALGLLLFSPVIVWAFVCISAALAVIAIGMSIYELIWKTNQ